MSHTKEQAATEHALGAANCPKITAERIAIVAKHLDVVDGEIRVVDSDGEGRLGAGDRPMTIRALIEEILGDRYGDDARKLRWRPYGHPVAG